MQNIMLQSPNDPSKLADLSLVRLYFKEGKKKSEKKENLKIIMQSSFFKI